MAGLKNVWSQQCKRHLQFKCERTELPLFGMFLAPAQALSPNPVKEQHRHIESEPTRTRARTHFDSRWCETRQQLKVRWQTQREFSAVLSGRSDLSLGLFNGSLHHILLPYFLLSIF